MGLTEMWRQLVWLTKGWAGSLGKRSGPLSKSRCASLHHTKECGEPSKHGQVLTPSGPSTKEERGRRRVNFGRGGDLKLRQQGGGEGGGSQTQNSSDLIGNRRNISPTPYLRVRRGYPRGEKRELNISRFFHWDPGILFVNYCGGRGGGGY